MEFQIIFFSHKSLLHHFISIGDTEQLSILLDNGADTSTPKCRNIIPPLHYAIKLKQNECVSIILESGADKNYKTASVGATPIITAIAAGNSVALELLLQKKADPNIPNSKGDLPIYYAIHQHDANSLSLLISNGARVNYEAIKYAIEMDDIECLHQLFQAIFKDKSIIELEEMNDSTYDNDTEETECFLENDREYALNMKIKQFQKDALNLARKLDRSSIELYLSLSPSKFGSVEGKEFIEKLHQLIFSNLKALNTKLNDNDFISLFFTNHNKYLNRSRNQQNMSQFQGLSLNQKSKKRKSNSVSFSSSSLRSESDEIYYSKTSQFNDNSGSYNTEENETRDSEKEGQNSVKMNSLFVFTNKIFSSIHSLNIYFRVLNNRSKSLKAEIKEIDNKSKENEDNKLADEIVDLWANQLKKTNDILKQLDNDVITPTSVDTISKWMNAIQQRKEFIETLLNRQIDQELSSSVIEEKKSAINSNLQIIRRCLKNREDHEVISKLTSSFSVFVGKLKSNTPHCSPKFDELVDLIQKDIVALPQFPTSRANRTMRGRISSNITQIITDKDKL